MQACSGSHDVAVTDEHRKHTPEVNTNLNMNLTSDYWVNLSNEHNMEQIDKATSAAAPSTVFKKGQNTKFYTRTVYSKRLPKKGCTTRT